MLLLRGEPVSHTCVYFAALPFFPDKPGRPDNIELIQLLMQALEGMKQKVCNTDQELKKMTKVAEERSHQIERLKEKVGDLTSRSVLSCLF